MEYGITGNIQYQYRRWNAMSKNCQMPLLFCISFSRVRNKDQNWSLWALPMHSKNSNLKNSNYFGDSCLVNSSICSLIKGKNNDSITRLNASQTWCHSWFRNVAILGEYLKWRSFLVHLPTNNMNFAWKNDYLINLRLQFSEMFNRTIFKTHSNNWFCALAHALLEARVDFDHYAWVLYFLAFCFSYKVMRLFPSTNGKMMQVYGMKEKLNITVKSFIPNDVSILYNW